MFHHLWDTADMSNSKGGGGFLPYDIPRCLKVLGFPDFPALKMVESISLGRLYITAFPLISPIPAM
jgi:hypothetical protein